MKSLLQYFVLVWLLLAAFPASHAQETPVAPAKEIQFHEDLKLSDEDKVRLSAFIGHALRYAQKITPEKVKEACLKSPEMFAWMDFRYLNCLNIAYELTGDTAYLDRFKDAFQFYRDIMTKGQDNYLGWYGSPIAARIPKDNPGLQIDEIQMNFRAIGILAKWVELAKSNPEFATKNSATITGYLDLMENHLYPKWDKRGFYADLKDLGGVYHGLDYPIEGGVTLSHEKLSIMLSASLALHRVTGNDDYLKRAIALGTRFKSCLSLKDGHYEWMSWVPAGTWDISPDKEDAWKVGWIAPDPNSGWYVTALSIALNLYQHGLVFNEEDLKRFIKTQKEMCWNGDMANPEYRTVAGTTGKFVKGRFLSYQLANYDPELIQLAFYGPHEEEAKADASSDWKGGANAQDYVTEKYLMQEKVKANPKPFQAVAEAFLAKPENRTYYDAMSFTVEEPGSVTPLKPSEAKF